MGNTESGGMALNMCMPANMRKLEAHQLAEAKDWEMNPDDIKEWCQKVRQRSQASVEAFNDRVERYERELLIPVQKLQRMVASFVHELEIGLDAVYRHPHEYVPQECSLKMLDSKIKQAPTGNENGVVYALDFGGTNFRVVRLTLKDGKVETEQLQVPLESAENARHLPKGLMSAEATATQMFDFFAETAKELMTKTGDWDIYNDKGAEAPAGFTFSYPCSQRRIDQATLMRWTKGFETGRATKDPVEGQDVAELMNVAFVRNGVPMKVVGVVNDTVGTLLSCAYELDTEVHPPCMVGMILGTGLNGCYIDESAPRFGYVGNIVNMECGNFNRDLPRINVDAELDFWAVSNRGLQHMEKMASGAYLGEIVRVTLLKIFQFRAPALAWVRDSLTAYDVARIMNDKSEQLIVTDQVIQEKWRVAMEPDDLQVVHRICRLVLDRSSALAAGMIAACAKKTGRLQAAMGGLTVAVDGTLYKKNQWYRERLRDHLNDILGERLASLIHVVMADDGSGKGAGVLAATLVAGQA